MRILNFHTYIYNNFELFIKCIDRLEVIDLFRRIETFDYSDN